MLDSDFLLPSHLLNDLFVTALESGVNYWALVNDYSYKDCSATIIDKEALQPAEYKVNLTTINRGLQILYLHSKNSELSKKRVSSILNQDYDAEDADVVLQYGLFGELIYG